MKKLLTFFAFALLIACSQNETALSKMDKNEFTGLTREQLNAISVASVTKNQ